MITTSSQYIIMISKIDLESNIADSFARLKFSPRGNQSQICYDVLDSFLNKEKKNVVLCAPVGIGKSILGAVVADTLNILTPDTEENGTFIGMSQNILGEQYRESFSTLDKYKVFQIKGASNYPCNYMEKQLSAIVKTADECVKSKLLPQESEKYCRNCEYDAARKMTNVTEILISNYTYFLISAMVTGHIKPRKLNIFDEAHGFNDDFCNFTEILVSVDHIDKCIKDLADTNGKCDNEIAGLIMLKNRVSSGEVGEGNYMQILEILQQIYISIESVLNSQSEGLTSIDIIKSSKYAKLARRFSSNAGKITDLFDNEYEHVFDNSVPHTFSVKTIFVGKMINKLLAPYNLFMSATITDQFAFDTLHLERDDTEFIEVGPVFPPENKKIFFVGKKPLNYHSMKDPDTIDELKKQIKMIVDFHGEDKGLILVPSFYLGSQLANSVGRGTRVFEHKSGIKLPEIVESFKRYKGSAILISPSIWEGLDFKDDLSRYAVLIKAPFFNISDKRIKYIADHHSNIYKEMTLIKILQGVGRSVRTPEDYAATYCLDPAIKTLYDSPLNIWKSHHQVMTN